MKRMMMVPGTPHVAPSSGKLRYTDEAESAARAAQEAERRWAVDEKRSTRDKGRGGGGRRRECWICHDPDHLSYECPDRNDSDEDDTKGGCSRSTSRRPRRDAKPRKEKQTSKKTSSTKDVDNSSGKSQGDGEASCSMVGVAEPTVSLAPEAGEYFQAVAAAMQANPMAVLLDSGCSHHLMGTKTVFVNMAPSDGVKHVHGFNGALQPVEGRGTVALQGEAGKRVLIPDVLYVTGIQANLLSAGQVKESGVQLHGNGDKMLLIAATGEVLVDARLAHVSVDTIKSSAKHKVATGLDITPSTGADPPCVSCVGGKLARHTFPDKGSDAEEALAVVHIDLCGPFRVAAKDGSLFFLLLKDRHTRFVWVMPVAKKSDVLWEFQKWLVLVEWQAKKSVLMLRSNRGGEFLGKEFTKFVDGKGIVHDLTCPYTPQQNGMAEREMCTGVESVRKMLPHMGVQHHWWHLAIRQAVWVRNCLERSTTPPGMTSYQLLTGKKPDLMLARVWGCMVQFMVPKQQRGGKLVPKARWGLHLGVLPESKGWEVLDLTENKVVTSVEAIFYETLSLEVWKAKFGPASGRTQAHPPTDTSTATVPLLAEVDEPANEDVVEVLPPSLVLAPPFPVADRPASTPVSATGDEGSLEASPVAPASDIARSEQLVEGSKKLVDDLTVDEEGELSAGEDSTDSDVVEVPITKLELRHTSRARRPPERLSFHACLPPAAFTAVYDEVDDDLLYDDAKEDEELPELDPDMHADPEHRWDIATMTVKEALASWKGEVVKVAMEEEIRSLVGMGTWDLVERPRGVNIMKNRALDAVLPGAGWKKSQVDEVLYYKAGNIGVTCWVLVYVDNLLAASSSPAMLKELKELLEELKELLEAAFELREISPDVKRFIDKEQGGRVSKTPVSVDAYVDLTFNDEEAQEREEEEYQQKVGSLQFAATTTRPYIAFACSKLGSGLTMRSDQHWHEVDPCLAYLADTRDTALEFGSGPESLELIGYVDADDAGDKQKRTSTSDYVFVYGGAAVSWLSSRIKCMTLSSTESEYVAATNAGKEGRRIRFLLAEFKLLDVGKPTILHIDNKSAITDAASLGLTGNLKHMERRYAWLQHMVRRGKFELKYIRTTEQPSDFLTKALHFPAFNRCFVAIGQVCLADVGDGDDNVQQ
ncbi:unnamed protein product [Closterium sp. NIES-53]